MLRDQIEAAGVVLSFAALVGAVDTWSCWTYASEMIVGALSHVCVDGAFGVLGLWLARG